MDFHAEKPIYLQIADAREKIMEAQRAEFLSKDVPAILRKMKLLGLDAKVFKEK